MLHNFRLNYIMPNKSLENYNDCTALCEDVLVGLLIREQLQFDFDRKLWCQIIQESHSHGNHCCRKSLVAVKMCYYWATSLCHYKHSVWVIESPPPSLSLLPSKTAVLSLQCIKSPVPFRWLNCAWNVVGAGCSEAALIRQHLLHWGEIRVCPN